MLNSIENSNRVFAPMEGAAARGDLSSMFPRVQKSSSSFAESGQDIITKSQYQLPLKMDNKHLELGALLLRRLPGSKVMKPMLPYIEETKPLMSRTNPAPVNDATIQEVLAASSMLLLNQSFPSSESSFESSTDENTCVNKNANTGKRKSSEAFDVNSGKLHTCRYCKELRVKNCNSFPSKCPNRPCKNCDSRHRLGRCKIQSIWVRKKSACKYCKELGMNCGKFANKCPNRPCSSCGGRHRLGRCKRLGCKECGEHADHKSKDCPVKRKLRNEAAKKRRRSQKSTKKDLSTIVAQTACI